MRRQGQGVTIATVLAVSTALSVNAFASDPSVQLGPRPFYLVEKMSASPLKSALQQCGDDSFKPSTFSIGHRGGGARIKANRFRRRRLGLFGSRFGRRLCA